jgi:diguanylate cyclase (GGDEF)-like protein
MKILLVEDDSDDADFLRLSLAQHNGSVSVTRTSSIADAVTALDGDRYDVVLLDLNLPDGRGAECVARIQEAESLVPIVVLSGHGDEDYAVEILNKGVQDYLVKWEGDGRTILRAIRYAIERKRAEAKLNYLARYDSLTRIPNRQYLRDQLAQAMTRALRRGRTMALLLLDLDRFKAVNETLGHEAGDALLRDAVQRLTSSVRDGDVLARLGGDEFAVLLEDVEGPTEAERLARSIGAAFQKPFDVGGRQVSVTVSIGVTICPADTTDPVALLNNADIAMSRAKEQGRNTFKFFTPGMHEEILSRHQLSSDLKDALARGQFELLYQPQLRLADHRVDTVEALLRWNHPQRGRLGPSEFLAAAEASGDIVPLGLWVVEEVCRQLKRWEGAGGPAPRVAINLSAVQLRQPKFHESVRGVLESHSVDASLIELELTEHGLLADPDAMRDSLHAIKSIGVRLAIDDFGAGHSCLSHLWDLPFDALKIDRSVVAGLQTSIDTQVKCSTILSLAHSLSLDAIAEGVETEQQAAFLTRHDCQYGQGFYFSVPLEADEIGALMARSGAQAARRRRVTKRRIAASGGRGA